MANRKNKYAQMVFHYGTMGSGKTAMALMLAHNLKEKGLSVLIIKSSLDTRDRAKTTKSRIGLTGKVLNFTPNENLLGVLSHKRFKNLVVDECQFCTETQIDQLRFLCDSRGINVYAYGLKTDFTSHFFAGSKRLFELSDKLIPIETFCECGKPASINARFIDGKVVKTGEQLVIGGDDLYKAMCYTCWSKR